MKTRTDETSKDTKMSSRLCMTAELLVLYQCWLSLFAYNFRPV